MSRNDLVELTLVQRAASAKAWGVTEDDDEDAGLIWLPCSECDRVEGTKKRLKSGYDSWTFVVPEWLAEEKGLI